MTRFQHFSQLRSSAGGLGNVSAEVKVFEYHYKTSNRRRYKYTEFEGLK